MIRVLHVISSLSGGGVESMLYNYYKPMVKSKIVFDFVVHDNNIGFLEEKFIALGSKIYHAIPKRENLLRNFIQLFLVIKNGNYDVIHCHQGLSSSIPLLISNICRVKHRIVHSHSVYDSTPIGTKLFYKLNKFIILSTSTHYLACSMDAANYLFGKEFCSKNSITIIKNLIDVTNFLYNEKHRADIRKELSISANDFVIGNVGRISPEKNQRFLIEIFKEIQKIRSNAVLLIVGKGDLENDLTQQVDKSSLNQKVIFTGERADIFRLLCAMDVFVLPSLYESFGVALLEAQASGLLCFASDSVIPKDVRVSNLIRFVDLKQPPSFWAEKIIHSSFSHSRLEVNRQLRNSEYDSNRNGKNLESLYVTLFHQKSL